MWSTSEGGGEIDGGNNIGVRGRPKLLEDSSDDEDGGDGGGGEDDDSEPGNDARV